MKLIFTLITSLSVFMALAANNAVPKKGPMALQTAIAAFSTPHVPHMNTGIFPPYLLKKALLNSQYSVGSTYMWKGIFESTHNDTLLNKLSYYGIDSLLLSPGNNANKINDFLTRAQNQNVHVSRLLSENSYAKDSNGIQKLILKLQTLQYNFPGLHLNIEPHTFSDYKNNIPFYTERMDSIYSTAKQWCNPRNIKLSVSIPMHLPLQNATYLADNDITPWIMAYENTNQEKLLQRTQLLRSTLQGNYVWVIRVVDFNTPQELLDAVAYLNANGVTRVALYDFSTVITMF